MTYRIRFPILALTLGMAFLLIGLQQGLAAKRSPDQVPKWQRWELNLKSSVTYTNPIQETDLQVLLISPLGETNRAYGFWDGGKNWKARFKPGFAGRWKFFTLCSDTANAGLHGQSGEFLCTAPVGDSIFAQHGPIQVSREQRHLEHSDRTPFFWLGDAAWQVAASTTLSEWRGYLKKRQAQKINATLWLLPATTAAKRKPFFTGRDCITINPDAFRELDTKIIEANRAGLLNAIAPLWEISDNETTRLPEDQAIHLLRYAVGRWGAEDVAWLIGFESDSTGAQAKRWQSIGRAVFNPVHHAPVILYPGESSWVFDAFRAERWVDILGISTSTVLDENSLPWLLSGPPAQERTKTPSRPLLSIAPAAESQPPVAGKSIDAEFSRRLLWWNTLLTTPAGVTYAAQDIATWQNTPTKPDWRAVLNLPGANAITALANAMPSFDYWELQPDPVLLTSAPNTATPLSHPIAVTSKTTGLIYLPEAQAIQLPATVFAPQTTATWLNLRNNQRQSAQPIAKDSGTIEITPPGTGDWLLILKPLATSAAATTDAKKLR